MSVADMRQNYTKGELLEAEADADPFRQFRAWFDAAAAAGLPEPNAMTLATADGAGRPSARVVLLKGFDEHGLVFYSHYTSRKGRELAANPRAALLFYWAHLERQVRVEGRVERLPVEESEAYFRSRPLASQIGAAASPQSEVVSREGLEERARRLREQHPDGVPMPETWGGTRVVPDVFEFWQGRPGRLHDRLAYRRLSGGTWKLERLGP